MTDDNGEVRIGTSWGSVGFRGPLVTLVVVMLFCTAALAYLLDRASRAADATATVIVSELTGHAALISTEGRLRAAEHLAMTRAQDRLTCVMTMTPEERKRFRDAWRSGAWAAWCGWVAEEK